MPLLFLNLCLCTAMSAADPSPTSAKATPLALFAEADWYQQAAGEEQVFEGTVELNPGTGQIGKPKRFNTYRLSWTTTDGTKMVRDIYAPGKAQFLAPYRGQRVRVVGKAVDTKADDKVYAEIWPARLESVGLASAD